MNVSGIPTVPGRTPPFAGFEWSLSLRYLRARRREGFISVIAGFSFAGIMLGVATLIIVMSVMNGFRSELLGKILGFNGHFMAQGQSIDISDYEQIAARLKAIDGVTHAIPLVEGQVMASSSRTAGGALVRGMTEENLRQLPGVANGIRAGTLDGFDTSEGVAIGIRHCDQARRERRRPDNPDFTARSRDTVRRRAEDPALYHRRDLPDRYV